MKRLGMFTEVETEQASLDAIVNGARFSPGTCSTSVELAKENLQATYKRNVHSKTNKHINAGKIDRILGKEVPSLFESRLECILVSR